MAKQPQFRTTARQRDITRLMDQYQKNVAAITGDYEKSFSAFTASNAAKMAPFDSAMATYQQQTLPAYEQQADAYRQSLAAYQKQLDDLTANPVYPITQREVVDVTWYGKKKYGDVTYWVPKDIPKFTETAPQMPNAPQAPQLDQFDSSQFEAQSKQAQSELGRELGERKGARLAAVSRKSSRPMLQGAA